jgi:hypothetical protein
MTQNNKEFYEEIMKKCYFKLYGSYKEYNKLQRSVYPSQYNDYFLLKIPKKFIKKYVPCDALLKNLVEYLWDKDIETTGWIMPTQDEMGFITFHKKTLNNENVINVIKKMFGEENMMIHDHTKKGPEAGKETLEWNDKLRIEYPSKIHYEITLWWDAISFTEEMIPWIHKKLNIKIPDVSKAMTRLGSCLILMK